MPGYRLIVLSRPTEGCEAEFNDWYQNKHLAQVIALPGFKSAQRFRLADDLSGRPSWPYLAIYEIETDDLDVAVHALKSTAGSENLLISPAIDTAGVYASVYEEMGPALRRADG